MAESTITTPFPIFRTANRYLLFDINTITYVRRVFHVTGVLIGGLPQAPQQNVFNGLPVELMPEETRLLVEKGVAYLVDDSAEHKRGFLGRRSLGQGLSEDEQRAFASSLQRQGREAARRTKDAALDRKKDAMRKIEEKGGKVGDWNDIPDDMFGGRREGRGQKKKSKGESRAGSRPAVTATATNSTPQTPDVEVGEETLSDSAPPQRGPPAPSVAPSESIASTAEEPLDITPTTSYPPLKHDPPQTSDQALLPLPDTTDSYPLFKHLHDKDYFLAPGLRFGCQYMAYPGDPLRFHSHFLCNGMDWDEEFDLLDLVGGGRLGTGVKKGFLIGGKQPAGGEVAKDGQEHVRTFCIEWGGM